MLNKIAVVLACIALVAGLAIFGVAMGFAHSLKEDNARLETLLAPYTASNTPAMGIENIIPPTVTPDAPETNPWAPAPETAPLVEDHDGYTVDENGTVTVTLDTTSPYPYRPLPPEYYFAEGEMIVLACKDADIPPLCQTPLIVPDGTPFLIHGCYEGFGMAAGLGTDQKNYVLKYIKCP